MSTRLATIRPLQVTALLSLMGLFISVYLWLYKSGVIGTLQCGTGGCEQVQASRYAVLFGVPVALYGVCGFGVLLGVSLVALQPAFANRRDVIALLLGLSSVGVLFAGYLTSLELFVIHAMCRWCVTTAALITLIWVTSLVAYTRSRIEVRPSATPGRTPAASTLEGRS